MSDSRVVDILYSYKKRLINLTASNKSILLLKPLKGRFFDLNELDYELGVPTIQYIENLLKGKKTQLCQYIDKNREQSNLLSLDLKKIYQKQQSVFEEQGTLDLCIGWPFVQGKLFDDSLIRCPLLLFPVSLNLNKNHWVIELRVHEIILNPSFILYYSRANQIPPDQTLLDFCIDEKADLIGVIKTVYDAIKLSSYEVHFPSHIFEKKINNFNFYNKKLLNEDSKTGVLNVIQEAVLGFFPQSTSSLLHDYEVLIDSVEQSNVNKLDSFFEKQELQRKIKKEQQIFAPYEMDVWQEKILEKVDDGGSLIVQGPPGSGKSQLIVNLISNAVAKRKSVLLVCQKRVALDVVYDRLKENEFSNFVGLIHDYKQDRKSLYKQIEEQVDMVEEYENNSLTVDDIHVERKYQHLSNHIDALCQNFNKIKEAFYNTNLCGVPIKNLYLMSSREGLKTNLSDLYSLFPMDKLDEYLLTLTKYFNYYFKIEEQGHLWLKRESFAGKTFLELEKIKTTIKNVSTLPQNISKHTFLKLKENLTIDDIKNVSKQLGIIDKFLLSIKEESISTCCDDFLKTIKNNNQLQDLKKNVNEYIETQSFTYKFILSSSDFLILDNQLTDFFQNKENKLKIWFWKNFTKKYEVLKRILSENTLSFDNQGILALSQQVGYRKKLIALYKKIKNFNTKILCFDDLLHPNKVQLWAENINNSIFVFEYYLILKVCLPWLKQSENNFNDVINAVKESKYIYIKVNRELEKYHEHLSHVQVKDLLSNVEIEKKYINELENVFDELCGIDNLVDKLDAHWQKLFSKLILEYNKNENKKIFSINVETNKIALVHNLFVNSLCYSWLGHAEHIFPQLSELGGINFKNDEKKLAEDIHHKRLLSRDMVLQELKERVIENLEYNRVKNRVTYRDLLAQVIKKRRIWPIRKLFSVFNDEILKLVPCWLASPESVSAVFPMLSNIDLVIFDEASQCFAEKGIPALMRGKQAVIVGDHQQLQPFDLYTSRYDDSHDEDTYEQEALSLLDLMQKYYSSINLQGHYRSQHDALIRFSNEQFYNNKLTVVPYYSIYKENSTPIEYKNVQGHWLSRKNIEEADYVCQLLRELTTQKIFSVGIITFNATHRDLIIEKWSNTSNIDENKGVFIKNIENVQGDERDIIIFSVGYGFDENEKLKAQFGSLNITGGENRLNVAVSRARKKMIIVCSFEPHQLDVEHTVNVGPKLLKEFLFFAKSYNQKYINNTNYTSINDINENKSKLMLNNAIINYLSKHHKSLKIANSMFTDIHLITSSNCHLLIFVDDGSFFQNENPKAFHAYMPKLFENRGWRYLCLYSRQYWWDRENFYRLIDEFIAKGI